MLHIHAVISHYSTGGQELLARAICILLRNQEQRGHGLKSILVVKTILFVPSAVNPGVPLVPEEDRTQVKVAVRGWMAPKAL